MRNGEQRQATRFRKSAAVAVHKPPTSPCLHPQSTQPLLEILGQTRLRKAAGDSCWDFLHGTTLFQESPKSPITQDESEITLQYADQSYRKDVHSEMTTQIGIYMNTKYKKCEKA